MSQAFRCDKCGKYFDDSLRSTSEIELKDSNLTRKGTSGFRVIFRIEALTYDTYKQVDLCKPCFYEISKTAAEKL